MINIEKNGAAVRSEYNLDFKVRVTLLLLAAMVVGGLLIYFMLGNIDYIVLLPIPLLMLYSEGLFAAISGGGY